MKRFWTFTILYCIGLCTLSACRKEGGGNPAGGEPELLLIKKITGPVLWEHFPTIAGYGSDSTLYSYNTNNRISHITYVGRHQSSGGTTSYKLESDLTYDSRGNVQKITLTGDPYILEKEVNFQYDTAARVTKAKIIFRADGNFIKENDSVVHTYLHRNDATPSVINGHTITDWVTVITDHYGNKSELTNYLMRWENGGYSYSYFLNKDNIPMQIWKTHFYFTTQVFENYRYEVIDSNIVAIKVYTNDLFAQGAPSEIDTYERTNIPNVNLQITKSIFGKNTWMSNIGVLSPFHTMEVSTFVKAANPNTPTALHFSFEVDSGARKITQLYKDQYGVFQPMTTYYFH